MAVRGNRTLITNWRGLVSLEGANATPDMWLSSNNVAVNRQGTAVVLRSPANFNTALAVGNPVISAFDYDKSTGNQILFDIQDSGNLLMYSTVGGGNTLIATSGGAPGRRHRLNINDQAYQVDGTGFVRHEGTDLFNIGLPAPSVTPTISWVSGGSGSFAAGVDVTYAYRDSVSGDVGKMSIASNRLTASTNPTLRVAVTASGLSNVNGIVIFLTVDGGSVRYLLVDATGAPQVFSNATGNIDISIASIFYDQLTPEPAYNDQPPTNAFQMFRWRDRIMLLDFRGATTRQQIQYSGYEAIPIGVPFNCYPPLNIINIPNKGDAARCGISTNLGALILAEQDSYLLSGYPSDKTSSGENSIAVTEHLEPMNWGLGTIYPRTLVTTPFGEMWLDQNRQIRLWNHSGFPPEIGAPIRAVLAAIQTTATAGDAAQAVWFDRSPLGGMYVLTASTTGSTNNKIFVVDLYQDPENGEKRVACWMSDIAVECLLVADISGKKRLFGGVTNRLRELFDVDTAGAGWGAETRTFSILLGNETEYCYWHSLRFDSQGTTGLTLTWSDPTPGESKTISVTANAQNGAYFGLIDSYGFRKLLTFSWSADDTTYRDLRNFRVIFKPTGRVL